MTEIFNEILSETEQAVRDTLRRFSVDVLRPIGKQLDLLTPEQVIAKDSIYWEAHQKYNDLGISQFSEDASLSPSEVARLRALSSEMLSWGDTGLAISLGLGSMAHDGGHYRSSQYFWWSRNHPGESHREITQGRQCLSGGGR